ncbi:sulfotransferase family protein [Adhaeretor mobilis]|uniref:Sulfotransferase n=1 Tax=Adhaeretor mobilis TaxID=1930276 RepID=A0A517MRM4_9BACT|nr:sulfotransferase [Adhaeretor mobilis]QDS97525.1 hypothetical protein HG15A2_07880 [Adhaeretor mobilis]
MESDDQLLTRPIVVVGAPRSGTTRLGQLIAAHPSLHEVEEPRLTWRYGNDSKSDALRPEDARPEVIAHIRKSFAEQIRKSGKTRLLEKTPSNSLRLGFVLRVLPDAKLVHITRNGIDSSLSIRSFWQNASQGTQHVMPGKWKARLREIKLRQIPYYAMEVLRRLAPRPLTKVVGKNLWGPRLPGLRGMVEELDLLEVAAQQWRACVEAARADGLQFAKESYNEIKLEELSLETFCRVLGFLELEDEHAVIENFQKVIDPKLATARRSAATAEDLVLLRKWIEPTMQWLDYDWPR